MTPARGPAPSGARQLGDDYQHLLTWLYAAQLLHRDQTVIRVELEKHAAGNVDDLVVHRQGGRALYHQVKFTTEPGQPLTCDWFTEGTATDKPPLRRFYESFEKLTVGGERPELVLHTNRLPAANDPILRCLNGTTELLVPKLERAGDRSNAGKARKQWAEGINVSEPQLLELLGTLQIRAAQASLNSLQEHCRWVMDAVGLLANLDAVDKGMLAARRWVETGTRDVIADTVNELVDKHQLRATEPIATVLIQAINHDPWPETATVALDWVDAYAKNDPERRKPRNQHAWKRRFEPELRAAAAKVAAGSYRRVRLDGAFRLATAVFAGSVFSDIAGFRLAIPGRSGDGTWTGDVSSDGDRIPPVLVRTEHTLGRGDHLAVGLNVSGDLTNAVLHHIDQASLPVDRLIILGVTQLGRDALTDPASVRGWATAVTDQLREIAEERHDQLHLFMHGPRAAATLLGHQWNRMPPTQLWDDLGAGRGYTPAFALPPH